MFNVVNNYKPAACENVCGTYSVGATCLPVETRFEVSPAVKLSGPTFKLPEPGVSFLENGVSFGSGPVYNVVESAAVGEFTPLHAANERDTTTAINLVVLFFMIIKNNRLNAKLNGHGKSLR